MNKLDLLGLAFLVSIVIAVFVAIGSAYAIDKEFRKCAGCHKI